MRTALDIAPVIYYEKIEGRDGDKTVPKRRVLKKTGNEGRIWESL